MSPQSRIISPLLVLSFASACAGSDPIIGTWDLRSLDGEAFPLTYEIEDYGCRVLVSMEAEVEEDLDGTLVTRYDYSSGCEEGDYAEITDLEVDPEGDRDYEITLFGDGQISFYACELDGDDELDCHDGAERMTLEKR